MCGLFGFINKKGKSINRFKIAVLGLYNIERGEHSCGYYWSGNISKGIDNNKKFGEFIANFPLAKGDLPNDIFIGHTRKATFGVHNEKNAHPHIINNSFVQTHNGTINNMWSMASKFDVETKDYDIDSHKLAAIIADKGFDVLNYYDGFAALAFTYKENPDTLYLYHGASRNKESDVVPIEERPMFILDMPEGLYYSSMENSLKFIADGKATPERLPVNGVYKITNGILEREPIYIVKREDTNIYKPVVSTSPKNTLSKADIKRLQKAKDYKQTNIIPNSDNDMDYPLVWRETYPLEHFGTKKVYYRFGRFFYDDNTLMNGEYIIDRDGIILQENETSNRVCEKYYFVRGAMMQDERAYLRLKQNHPDILSGEQSNQAFHLSQYSRYPVTTFFGENYPVALKFCCMWWKDKKKYNGSFQTKFSMRKYNTNSYGTLESVTRAFADEKILEEKGTILQDYIVDGVFPTPVKVEGFRLGGQVSENDKGAQIVLFRPPTQWTSKVHEADGMVEYFDSDGKLLWRGIEDDEHESFVDKSENNPSISDLMNEVTLGSIVGMVHSWCDVLLEEKNIKDVPEQFLMLVENIVYKINAKANPGVFLTEAQAEQQTTGYLLDMIEYGMSLNDTLKDEPEFAKMTLPCNIKECFKAYDATELIALKNRYHFIEFYAPDNTNSKTNKTTIDWNNDFPVIPSPLKDEESLEVDWVEASAAREAKKDQEKEMTEKKLTILVQQLRELIKIADELQAMPSEIDQQTAYNIYRTAHDLKKSTLATAEDNKFTDLIADLKNISI